MTIECCRNFIVMYVINLNANSSYLPTIVEAAAMPPMVRHGSQTCWRLGEKCVGSVIVSYAVVT